MRKRLFILSAAAVLAALPVMSAQVTVDNSGGVSRLLVDGQPFIVKGIGYGPEKVGEDPNIATLRNWMFVDDNRNGRVDAAYDAFVDVNGDNAQDAAEPAIGDWALLRDMGANTIRLYHHPSDDPSVQAGYGGNTSVLLQFNRAPDKALLRDAFNRFGIRVAMGDFFGAYRIGSGVASSTTTVYSDSTQRARMIASVQQMVTDFKDEDFLLMYVLGNENNLAAFTATDAQSDPESFAEAIGEAVALIKAQDPNHPVAVSLGDLPADLTSRLANLPLGQRPDILGSNVYRGTAFETIFASATAAGWLGPVLFTEYGDQAASFIGSELNETQQSNVLAEGWNDIVANVAGSGTGRAIGGLAFAWLDNWWQEGTPNEHTINGGFENEWHGFASQGSGARSPFLRRLRLVYTTYQGLWGTNVRSAAGGGRFLFPYEGTYATVDVPDGAFGAGTTVTFSTNVASFPVAASIAQDLSPTGRGAEITASGGAQPAKPLTIFLPFSHANGPFVLARYDAVQNVWVPLRTRRDATGALIATTNHLSLFQVMQASASATTATLLAYPNPARPARGHTGMRFSNVPVGTTVKLFTTTGETVREIQADVTGVAFWDLTNRDGRAAASGVYFAIVDGPGGQQIEKVAVQR